MTVREVKALLAACADDPRPCGRRDAAIIALMTLAGFGPANIVRLNLSDYDDGLRTVSCPLTVTVRATRIVVLAGACGVALEQWLAVRGSGPGNLFLPMDRYGRTGVGDRIGASAINHILRQRGKQAFLGQPRPRDLKATYLAWLREEVRQNPLNPGGRFGLDDEGEARLVVASLDVALEIQDREVPRGADVVAEE